MPELPEVEAVSVKLREMAVGATIAEGVVTRAGMTRPQGEAEFARIVKGRTILGVSRRAKNIVLHLDRARAVRVHLGMTGNCYVIPDYRLRPHLSRVHLRFKDGRAMVLEDSRTFGRMTAHGEAELAALFADYGVEPLSEAFTLEHLWGLAQGSRLGAKLFLMDQGKIAGLGNIWAAEALYVARLHPAKVMKELSKARVKRLHGAVIEVLTRAVQSALAIYTKPSFFPEAELIGLSVYGRAGEPCFRCGVAIEKITQGGRSTYFCSGCQK